MSAQKGGSKRGRMLTAFFKYINNSYQVKNFINEEKTVQEFCTQQLKTRKDADNVKKAITETINAKNDERISETLGFVERMLGVNPLKIEKDGSYSKPMVSSADFYVIYGKKSQRIVTSTNWYDVIAESLADGLNSLSSPQKDDIEAHTINTSAFINNFKDKITEGAKTNIKSIIEGYCNENGKYKILSDQAKEDIKSLFGGATNNFDNTLNTAIDGIKQVTEGGTRRRKRGGRKSKAKKSSKNKTNKKRKRKGSKKSRK